MSLEKKKVIFRRFMQIIYCKHYIILFFYFACLYYYSGRFTHNPNAKVPWSALAKDPDHYLEEGSLPEGVSLVEPTKLRAEELTQLWIHWRNTQKQGGYPLLFKEALEKDKRPHGGGGAKEKKTKGKGKGKAAVRIKGKGKSRYVEIDKSSSESSDESSDSDEEDKEDESDDSESEDNEPPPKTTWGPAGLPPKGKKGRGIGEAGSSGLSVQAKNTPSTFWASNKKKRQMSPLLEMSGDEALRRKKRKSRGAKGGPSYDSHPSDRDSEDAVLENLVPSDPVQPSSPAFDKAAGAHPARPALDEAADAHLASPASKVQAEDRLIYLKGLSSNKHYRDLVEMIDNEKVCYFSIIFRYILTNYLGKLPAHSWFPILGILDLRPFIPAC